MSPTVFRLLAALFVVSLHGCAEPAREPRVTQAMGRRPRPVSTAQAPVATDTSDEPETQPAFTEPEQPEQISGPLTLDQVLASVETHFPLLLAVEEELNIAEGGLLSAEGGFDLIARAELVDKPQGFYRNDAFNSVFEQPTPLWGTTFYSGYRWGQGDFPPYDDDFRTDRGGEVRAGIKVPLLQGGPIDARRANLSRARIDVDIAEPKIQSKRIAFRRKSAQLFWRWVGAGQKLQIAQNLLNLAEQRNTAVRRRVEQGDLPALELKDNERLIELRKAIVVAARRTFQQASIALSLYYRDEIGQPLLPPAERLPAGFPQPAPPNPQQVDEDSRRALDWRPDVRQIALERDRTEVDLKEAENKLLPKVDMLLETSKDFDRAPEVMDRTPAELIWKVQFEMPTWLRDARGQIRSTKARISKLSGELKFARESVVADVQDAMSELIASYERWERTRDSLKFAREVEAGEKKSFQLGNSTILLVNLREEASATTAALEADALAAYFQAIADYRAATAADLWDATDPVEGSIDIDRFDTTIEE